MFRHQGKSRTHKHNLRIATVLSFVAGIVNVAGFLGFRELTTNVTGHFAFFVRDVAEFEVWKGAVYLLFIFCFLLGSFTSSFLIEEFRENKLLNVFVLPTAIESMILVLVPILGGFLPMQSSNVIVYLLLFAMGLQNSFVTKISNAVVRTTHLTGLFTDLGIEISKLFFPKNHPDQAKIKADIRLRVFIISFFFFGGLCGGYGFSRLGFGLGTLYFAALILILSLFYDDLRFRFIKTHRKRKAGKEAKG
jgi:uncharacterized membrane protein YoaK (UPF0700 family)